jgi:DNA-binding CsgD family transcriptional regulator
MSSSFELSQASRRRPQATSQPFHRAGQAPLPHRKDGSDGESSAAAQGTSDARPVLSDAFGLPERILPEALDALNVAVFATDISGQLLFANRLAQQILKTRDGLSLTGQGTLEAARANARPSLLELINLAASASASGEASAKDAILIVKRPYGRRPLTVVVHSVRGVRPSSEFPVASVLIFALDPERSAEISESGLRQLHCITAREARLANLLIEGHTLEECCETLNIQISTARMHLGSMFAKTGVQRQSQLVSRLLRSLGAICCPNDMSSVTVPAGMNARTSPAKKVAAALEAGREALDCLGVGVALTSKARQLLFANQTASRILEAGDGLDLTSGVLSTMEHPGNPPWDPLQPLKPHPSRRVQNGGRDILMAAVRRSGRKPLTLMIRRPSDFSSAQEHEPVFLIFVLDPERSVRVAEDGLRQLYGLTPSESRLANLLMEGHPFDACCKALQIRPSTARMHLSNLFAKTGVQRQGQLISLLVRSLGILPCWDPVDPKQEDKLNAAPANSWQGPCDEYV